MFSKWFDYIGNQPETGKEIFIMPAMNPYANYRDQSVNTATPGELIVMLFNGALRNISIASNAINNRDIESAHNAIIKTQNIFCALLAGLDQSLEVSRGIKDLYDYILDRLVDANIKKDKDVLAEVSELTQELRDTWQEAERKTHMTQARSAQRA